MAAMRSQQSSDGLWRQVVDVQDSYLELLTRVNEDGTLIGVCASTAVGPTLEYYMNRPAVSGADDRGAAFVLGAALDILELTR
jgi:hypothetical protein